MSASYDISVEILFNEHFAFPNLLSHEVFKN